MTDGSISRPSRPGNATWNYAEQSMHSIDIEQAFAAWVDDAWKAHGSKEYQETEEIFDAGSIVIGDSTDKEMINSPTGHNHMADDKEDYGFLSTPVTDAHDQSRQTPSRDSLESLSGDMQVVPCAWTGDQPCNSEEGVESLAQINTPVNTNQLATPEGLDVLRVDTEASQGPSTTDERPAREDSCSSSLPVYVVVYPHVDMCQTGNTFSSGSLDTDQRPLVCGKPFVRGGSQLQNDLSVDLNQHATLQTLTLLSVETQAGQLPSTGYKRHVSEKSSVSSPPTGVSAEPHQAAMCNSIEVRASEDLQVSQHPVIGDQLRLREECTRGSVQIDAHVYIRQVPTHERQDISSADPQAGPGLLTGDERHVREERCGLRPPNGVCCAPNQLAIRERPGVGEGCPDSKTTRVVRRRRRHTSANMSMCSECGSSFVRSGSLSRHMTFVHHKCCLCPATFPDICKLAAHLISHSYELM